VPSNRAAPVLTARSGRVKDARALLMAKHRRERGQLLAEGPQAVREALVEGVVAHVFVDPAVVDRRRRELEAARLRGVAVHLVDGAALATLTTAQAPQGIIAVCHWEPSGLADLLTELAEDTAGQLVVAHEMADPGNAGALIRAADAAGARGVVLSDGSVDPTNPKCVRASAGSLFHLPVVAAGATPAVVLTAREAGWRTLAADVAPHATDLFAAERRGLLSGRVAWVFGNEAHGLSAEVLAAVDDVVRIPILGRAESLNVATAAAICLYAYARRSAATG
jgi:RNA methyltransferase, TrmH family